MDDPIVTTDITTENSEELMRLLEAAQEEHTVIEHIKDIDIETDVLQTNFDMHVNSKSATDQVTSKSVDKYNRVMSYAAKLKNVGFQLLHLEESWWWSTPPCPGTQGRVTHNKKGIVSKCLRCLR